MCVRMPVHMCVQVPMNVHVFAYVCEHMNASSCVCGAEACVCVCMFVRSSEGNLGCHSSGVIHVFVEMGLSMSWNLHRILVWGGQGDPLILLSLPLRAVITKTYHHSQPRLLGCEDSAQSSWVQRKQVTEWWADLPGSSLIVYTTPTHCSGQDSGVRMCLDTDSSREASRAQKVFF